MTASPAALRPVIRALPLVLALALAACGGGGGGSGADSVSSRADAGVASGKGGRKVVTPAFETYVTQHNGYNRVRLDKSTGAADDKILAQFDDANPASPAGYRSLIAKQEKVFSKHMFIEVIGEVDTVNGKQQVSRILRMTTDQKPLNTRKGATGKFYFRGENYVWASLDGGAVQAGSHERGLENLVIDFDKGTVDLDLITGVAGSSKLRTRLKAEGLPFNISTGAYGGKVTLKVWDNSSRDKLKAGGSLRGNVGGSPTYANSKHRLTTSGLYTISGADKKTGRKLRADGVFFGADPNALP